ncbi:zinc finger protein 555-like [Oppia nitens]|uniref:zinc finger protein 555-like n=1 Tax=Oppia nitens TaxID=1686743 RepID=UPI0023DB71E7|nr:zinc finger protein 555-like [Oppia nitens]
MFTKISKKSSKKLPSITVTVGDIVDELWTENCRLLKQLELANKWLRLFADLTARLDALESSVAAKMLATDDHYQRVRRQLRGVCAERHESIVKDLKVVVRTSKVVDDSGCCFTNEVIDDNSVGVVVVGGKVDNKSDDLTARKDNTQVLNEVSTDDDDDDGGGGDDDYRPQSGGDDEDSDEGDDDNNNNNNNTNAIVTDESLLSSSLAMKKKTKSERTAAEDMAYVQWKSSYGSTYAERQKFWDNELDGFICPETDCRKHYPNYRAFSEHLARVHPYKLYACDQSGCEMRFKRLISLNLHRQRIHKIKSLSKKQWQTFQRKSVVFVDNNIEVNDNNSQQLKDELEKHFDFGFNAYVCPHESCEGTKNNRCYPTYRQFYEHMTRSHSTARYTCDQPGCPRIYRRLDSLRRHQRRHLSGAILKTGMPSSTAVKEKKKEFSGGGERGPICPLNVEQRRECFDADKRVYQCPESTFGCGRPYDTMHKFYKHLITVHPLLHFRCDYSGGVADANNKRCNRLFKTRREYRYHMEWHQSGGINQFKCKIDNCPLVFTSTPRLYKHRQAEHGMTYKSMQRYFYPQQCTWPGCDYVQKYHGDLNKHMGVHVDVPAIHQCDWPGCERAFKRPESLRIHKQMHQNERQYPCHWPECEHRANHKSGLASHIRKVHTKRYIKKISSSSGGYNANNS